MIYITGDCHGDFTKFSTDQFPEQKNMSKSDYVIVCGDFGGVWADTKQQKYWLDWLEKKPFTTLWVDGNHENYDLLATYQISEWHGGKVQFIRPSIIHLMRGQVFNIDGETFFTMGGASSHDISDGILDPAAPDFERRYFMARRYRMMVRVNHYSWWKEELPSEEEYNEARKNLDTVGWKVDHIITHCAPDSIEDIIGHGGYEHDALTAFLEKVYQKAQFKDWHFGHYHHDVRMGNRFYLHYNDIVPLPAKEA